MQLPDALLLETSNLGIEQAVAQVLAYVYRLKASLRGEAPAPGDLAPPDVPEELDPHNKKRFAE